MLSVAPITPTVVMLLPPGKLASVTESEMDALEHWMSLAASALDSRRLLRTVTVAPALHITEADSPAEPMSEL
ncbi:MAG: hypothetical protein IPK74_38990 [Deltaproteobacteria bacterium]|nr:hypothetical protein [Deltaproteobacteria bacterium]